jgi:hypothetical protein
VELHPGTTTLPEQLKQEKAAYDRVQDHRHVLKAFDLHEVRLGGAHLLILALEYADGGSLRTWLNAHRADPPARASQGMTWFHQACLGVAAIHDAGMAHRDLKPDNIVIVRGQCKVADLSASSPAGGISLLGGSPDCGAAEPYRAGTPVYMSPEHFTAAHPEDLDNRADIYAMGVILHEMLHSQGRPPFGGGYERLRELHTSVSPPPLTGVSETYRWVVTRCLAKDPAARFQGARDLLDALSGVSTPAGSLEPPDPIVTKWDQARACIRQRQFGQAMNLCTQILRTRPEHANAQGMADELRRREQQAQQVYAAIEQGLERRSLGELADLLREAMELYPNHPSGRIAQIQLLARSREYRMAMSRGAEAVRAREWVEAREYFLRAQQANVGGLAATDAVCRTDRIVNELETMRRRIDEAIAAKEWRAAMALARRLDEYAEDIAHANSHSQRGTRS